MGKKTCSAQRVIVAFICFFSLMSFIIPLMDEDGPINNNNNNIATPHNHIDADVDVNADVHHVNSIGVDSSSSSGSQQNIPQSTNFDSVKYEKQLSESMRPFKNETTVAFLQGLPGGFRNQFMVFAGIICMVDESNHSQIIIQSIKWKDLFGTNKKIRHDYFFDVVHWNSFYPALPRLVEYDPSVFKDVKFFGDKLSPKKKWNVYEWNATNPYAIGRTGQQASNQFKQYTKRILEGKQNRSNWDLLMLKDAFRPHPRIQQVIDAFLDSLRENGKPLSFMALHARVEPDMQKHIMCKELKVTNISDIVTNLYRQFKEPPVSKVLVILNRAILEEEVSNSNLDNRNTLAEHNLMVLNEIVEAGLWGGRVQVVEAGTGLAKQSTYFISSKYWALVGSIIDFFLAVEASIFVGTAVSSFSVDIEITRFYREKKENYHYLPDKLELSTATGPPRFDC